MKNRQLTDYSVKGYSSNITVFASYDNGDEEIHSFDSYNFNDYSQEDNWKDVLESINNDSELFDKLFNDAAFFNRLADWSLS